MDYPGNLFVVAAPSGTGKSSLVKALLELDSRPQVSNSHTTRPPRGQEQDGREYFFIGKPTFQAMIDHGDFFEWAEVHGNLYGTSRNTLTLIRNAGIEPQVVHSLETPPTREQLVQLVQLVAACGLSVREVLRSKGEVYDALQLDDPKWSDDELLDFMVAHPILINRPIAVTAKGTQLCRPSERVLDILLQAQQGAFTKVDGQAVVDEKGHRLV